MKKLLLVLLVTSSAHAAIPSPGGDWVRVAMSHDHMIYAKARAMHDTHHGIQTVITQVDRHNGRSQTFTAEIDDSSCEAGYGPLKLRDVGTGKRYGGSYASGVQSVSSVVGEWLCAMRQ